MAAGQMEERDSKGAVRLVDVADGLGAWVVLRDSAAVGEAGVAEIARAGVDLVEADQIRTFRSPRAGTE